MTDLMGRIIIFMVNDFLSFFPSWSYAIIILSLAEEGWIWSLLILSCSSFSFPCLVRNETKKNIPSGLPCVPPSIRSFLPFTAVETAEGFRAQAERYLPLLSLVLFNWLQPIHPCKRWPKNHHPQLWPWMLRAQQEEEEQEEEVEVVSWNSLCSSPPLLPQGRA